MAEALIGRLEGKTDEQEELWKAWTERGPQGPIAETPAMELP